MDHSRRIEREEFIDLGTELKHKRTKHIYKRYKAVYETKKFERDDIICRNETLAAAIPVPPIPKKTKELSGRIESFKLHLDKCVNYKIFVSARAMVPSGVDGNSSVVALLQNIRMQSWSNGKRQRCDNEVLPGDSEATELAQLHRCLVEYQADNLPPGTFIKRPSTKRLLHQVRKMSVILSRCSSVANNLEVILDGYALRCEGEDSTNLTDHQNSTGGVSISCLVVGKIYRWRS
ncbi:LOW QUALITY PROTEIN: hypothetical protein PHPALM_827 [Phytophthora palmivora]|uniref:Uncharacterized protein n=1 Tax=Phytophthora palmivora TaxID=4796 RepID=A0A2P4YTV5_9STRA|nr:LOW QUALITY PROTEIN: hypothetical protein PHPALM_827 [Phytophthora palmivora]